MGAFHAVCCPLPILIGIASAYVLTCVFGATDRGIRCVHTPVAECRVLQTRFFGLVGNSEFAISESGIRGAKTVMLQPHSDRRAAVSYAVNLVLDPGSRYPDYPVLSYAVQSQADASTAKLNAYFGDPATPSIEIISGVLTAFLIHGIELFAIAGLLFVLLWFWDHHRRRALAEGG